MRYFAAVTVVAMLLIAGCSLGEKEAAKSSTEPLYSYKDSYVGDNSAVGGIVDKLPGSVYQQGLSLQTKNRPYGITVKYAPSEGADAGDQDEFMEYWKAPQDRTLITGNATVLMALVQNADYVTFEMGDPLNQSVTVTRNELETRYGHDLRDFAKDEGTWGRLFEDMDASAG
jgi:hypothetical protein